MRGELTPEVQAIAKRMIGRELISTSELRLLPYLQFIMMNDQKIEPMKINLEDRHILNKWKEEGFCEGRMNGLRITKEFWNFMNEILYQSYVKSNGEIKHEH